MDKNNSKAIHKIIDVAKRILNAMYLLYRTADHRTYLPFMGPRILLSMTMVATWATIAVRRSSEEQGKGKWREGRGNSGV